MSLIRLAIKHGQTLESARTRLGLTVDEVLQKYGFLVLQTDWSEDRNTVTMQGRGFHLQMTVDEQELHVDCDIPFIARVLAGPVVTGLKEIVQQTFQKLLTQTGPPANPSK